jgi:hypothetical protein
MNAKFPKHIKRRNTISRNGGFFCYVPKWFRWINNISRNTKSALDIIYDVLLPSNKGTNDVREMKIKKFTYYEKRNRT